MTSWNRTSGVWCANFKPTDLVGSATASLDDPTEAKSQVWKDVHRSRAPFEPFGMDRGPGKARAVEPAAVDRSTSLHQPYTVSPRFWQPR